MNFMCIDLAPSEKEYSAINICSHEEGRIIVHDTFISNHLPDLKSFFLNSIRRHNIMPRNIIVDDHSGIVLSWLERKQRFSHRP